MVATIMALSCGKEVVTKEVIKEAEPKLSVSCFTGSAVEIESTSAKISGMAAIVNASAQNGSSAFYYSASAPASTAAAAGRCTSVTGISITTALTAFRDRRR